MRKASLFALLAATVFVYACNKDDNDNNNQSFNTTDQQFMINACYGNHAEIDAGQVAKTQGMRDSIKMFGQMMVTDHTMSQQSLDSIAGAFNMSVPTSADSMHIVMLQQMKLLTGHNFDTAYIHAQVIDHVKTINLFQDEVNNGNNQWLKNYANRYLPIIQMHYNMATSISASE